MFVPGAKRASAGGLIWDGAGNVAVGVGLGEGVDPRVTVTFADVVVS